MASQLGVAINFGFTGTDGAVMSGTLVGTFTLQSAEHTKNADEFMIKDADGDASNITYSNFNDEAQFEYIVRGSGIADAITQSTIPIPGTIVTVTTCASLPSLVSSAWIVKSGVKIGGSNTDAKKVTLPLHKFPGITAAASA